jgi:hypothetical protein
VPGSTDGRLYRAVDKLLVHETAHEIGRQPAAQLALEGIVGAELMQGDDQLGGLEDQLGGLDIADVVADSRSCRGLERTTSCPRDAGAIMAHAPVPYQLLDGHKLPEAGGLEARDQVAAIDLVLQQQRETPAGSRFGLTRVRTRSGSAGSSPPIRRRLRRRTGAGAITMGASGVGGWGKVSGARPKRAGSGRTTRGRWPALARARGGRRRRGPAGWHVGAAGGGRRGPRTRCPR